MFKLFSIFLTNYLNFYWNSLPVSEENNNKNHKLK
jgi:hypothetical protein